MSTWTVKAHQLYDHHLDQMEDIRRMNETAQATTTQQERRHRGIISARSAEGDEARLRGIPAIGRNVAGAIPGTSPHAIR